MKIAWLYLRHKTDKRYHIFTEGLKKHGYKIYDGLPTPNCGKNDIFITWNRMSAANKIADDFIKKGLKVLVAENASWGNDFAEKKWFHIARNYHNTSGMFEIGDYERWDNLSIELKAFRKNGETVILPQRGIGSEPTKMPGIWPNIALKKYGGRIRKHPGKNQTISLEKDLKSAGKVIVWGSGAGIKALMMGIPVISEMPRWIGEQDNSDKGRLEMFRRLAWAQWTHEEIENGYAFEALLQ